MKQLQLFQKEIKPQRKIFFSKLSIHEKINVRAFVNIGFYPFSMWHYYYSPMDGYYLRKSKQLDKKWFAQHKLRRRDDWKDEYQLKQTLF